MAPGPVAEEHAGGAVVPVEDAREGFGADHEGALVRARLQELVGRRDRVDEAGADRLQVEGGAVGHAETGLDHGGGRREGVVRRRGGADDEVDVGGRQPGIGEGRLGRLDAEDRRGLVVVRDVARLDAGALHDPLVRGLDQLFEILVRQPAPRQIGADAAYDGTGAFQDASSSGRSGSTGSCSSMVRIVFINSKCAMS